MACYTVLLPRCSQTPVSQGFFVGCPSPAVADTLLPKQCAQHKEFSWWIRITLHLSPTLVWLKGLKGHERSKQLSCAFSNWINGWVTQRSRIMYGSYRTIVSTHWKCQQKKSPGCCSCRKILTNKEKSIIPTIPQPSRHSNSKHLLWPGRWFTIPNDCCFKAPGEQSTTSSTNHRVSK